MKWTDEKLKGVPEKKGFRLRGVEMTRLETFCDAAFAFATTLIVISVGGIPKSFHELAMALRGIPAFAGSFASITMLWVAHRKWSRRYGLEDTPSILISLIFIFIMLVYVYPLKMLYSALFSWLSNNWFPSSFEMQKNSDLTNLFIVFGLGFAAVSVILALLYKHALNKADELQLNAVEKMLTQEEIVSSLVLGLTATGSAVFAWIMPYRIGVWSGFIYMILPVIMPIIAVRYAKEVEKLKNENRPE